MYILWWAMVTGFFTSLLYLSLMTYRFLKTIEGEKWYMKQSRNGRTVAQKRKGILVMMTYIGVPACIAYWCFVRQIEFQQFSVFKAHIILAMYTVCFWPQIFFAYDAIRYKKARLADLKLAQYAFVGISLFLSCIMVFL